jgi:hypothetical protein
MTGYNKLQQQTAGESQVSSEVKLDSFDLVPARKRHLAQHQCLPSNGTEFSTIPCKGRPFSVKHRIPWWRSSTTRSCHPPGGRYFKDVHPLISLRSRVKPQRRNCLSTETQMQLSWCMLLIGNMTDTIFTGNSLFLPWLLSFWQLWYATVTHIYSGNLYKIRGTTQPAENSNPGIESGSLSEASPEQQPSASQVVQWEWKEVGVCHLHCTNSGLRQIPNWQDRQEGRWEWTTTTTTATLCRELGIFISLCCCRQGYSVLTVNVWR